MRGGLAALELRVAKLAKVVPYQPAPLQCVRMINLCGVAISDEMQYAMADEVIAAHDAPTCPEHCLCDTIAGRRRCERFLSWLMIELYCDQDGYLVAWCKLGIFTSDFYIEGGICTPHTVANPVTGELIYASGEGII